jgi:hypothetical protein
MIPASLCGNETFLAKAWSRRKLTFKKRSKIGLTTVGGPHPEV